MKKHLFLLSSIGFFAACNPSGPNPHAEDKYFDIQNYFQQEALRLNKAKPLVEKTVMVNGAEEKKKVSIADWNREFSVFSDADINKSAWKGAFKVTKTKNEELYVNTEDKIPVKQVLIYRAGNQITGIKILQNTANYLYNSVDTLVYYPDSLYQISKTQHIRLLNAKAYKVTGKF
ncbi:hypothetical protein DBR11_26090 [Pedobacter sp. HMWF019]|uniref:hypothetical protein n=1 Tax=Pedobacter sp. HMWF019 TaxID=2056856 RepID=UPI000D348F2D|nr:hypothetical protein [Pedobacter sp. HMWF019]PTS92931.1 hypothetical protein DBR11_26090 [Pedobacter sp. HMWF019]